MYRAHFTHCWDVHGAVACLQLAGVTMRGFYTGSGSEERTPGGLSLADWQGRGEMSENVGMILYTFTKVERFVSHFSTQLYIQGSNSPKLCDFSNVSVNRPTVNEHYNS